MPNDTASARHRPAIAFMPPGEHILRWFCDPKGKIWHFVDIHQVGPSRTHCPDAFREWNPAGTYPRCQLCQLATQRSDRRLRRERLVLLYGTVIFTENPSPYWRPSRPKLIIAPDEIRAGFTKLLTQGSAEQRAHFYVTLGEWYIPLRECWMPEFNLADYEALVAQVTRHNRTATDHEHTRTEEEGPDRRDNTR